MSHVTNRGEGNSFTRSVSVAFDEGEHTFKVTKRIGYGSSAKTREEAYELTSAKITSSASTTSGTIDPLDWRHGVNIFGRRILKSGERSDTIKSISDYDLGASGSNAPEENKAEGRRLEALRDELRREHATTLRISIIEEAGR